LSQVQLEKLKTAQAILSHSYPDGNYSKIIEALCEKVIQKKEAPKLRKGSKATAATAATSSTKTAEASKSPTKIKASSRVFIPTVTQKYISHKALHCCEDVVF
jgi:hypothetical protein